MINRKTVLLSEENFPNKKKEKIDMIRVKRRADIKRGIESLSKWINFIKREAVKKVPGNVVSLLFQ